MKLEEPALRRRHLAVSVVSVAIGILAWFGLTSLWPGSSQPLVDDLRLPPPQLVANTLVDHAGVFALAALATFSRVCLGLALGAAVGIVLAFAMVRRPMLHAAVDPFIEGLRPIPPFGLIPFLILWLGLGASGQILIIGLGAFMVMVVTAIVAVNSVERRFVNAARSLGADERTVFSAVVIPAVTPSLLSGMRVAAATATGLATAAEYLGAQSGLGFLIRNARVTLNTESILLALMILGSGSALLDRIIRRAGAKATRWLDRPLDSQTQ